ncbi:OB-fold nucleic acid binding domain-containing protein [Aeromicrobium sp.]|uniref:OB-fold nucleic acid binding domain-containing protein n=1 Tax=Aeromicrobium sp. TaxID=1871063 RepID=UPI003D6AEC48
MSGLFSRTLEKFSPEHQEADELQENAAKAGCSPIKTQPDRCVATVHGTLRSVTLRPIDGVTALEAELYDGSDTVTLIWLGRRTIEGVEAGRRLTVHGRIGRRRDERVLYNPRYELEA